jgi:hypothetical protein
MEGQALTWFLLAQKDAYSGRAALHCLSYDFLPVVLQHLLPAVLTAPIHILPLSTSALFWYEEETLVSAYLSAQCQLGTQQSNSNPF